MKILKCITVVIFMMTVQTLMLKGPAQTPQMSDRDFSK